ncbi:MAG TPA: hypothetical protein VIX73_02140, partial [Kofleriaceae bacterium]
MGLEHIQRRADASLGSATPAADISPGKRTLTEGMISRQPAAAPGAETEDKAGAAEAGAAEAGGAAAGGGGIAVVNAGASADPIKRDPSGAVGPLAGSALGASDVPAGAAMGAALGGIARAPDGGIARQPPGPRGRPAAAPAHPTAIASTGTYGAALNYGKHFLHTFV